jgi:hypothetical protein
VRPQWRGGFAGFDAFAAALGVRLEPFQRVIARAALDGDERETVATLPRGNGKTALAGLVALHHLVTVEGASIALGAASREQASVAYQAMTHYLAHPALDGVVLARAHELRAERGLLRVVSGRGDRAHGRTDSLMVLDELHVASPALLDAFETSLVKRADARLLVISTAAESTASPLARLRERALAGDAVRNGALLDARAPGLRFLEWSVAEGDELTPEAAKSANPAPWLTSRRSPSSDSAARPPPGRPSIAAARSRAAPDGCPRAHGRRAAPTTASGATSRSSSPSTSAAPRPRRSPSRSRATCASARWSSCAVTAPCSASRNGCAS